MMQQVSEGEELIEEKTLLSPSQERVLSHREVQVGYKIFPTGAEGWKDPLDSLGKKIAGEYCKQVLVENCLSEENWKNLRLLHRNCIILIPLVTVLQSPLKRQETEWNWVLDPIKPKHLPSTLENALRKEVEEEYVVPKGKNKSRGVVGSSWALWHHQIPGKFLNKIDFQTSGERQFCGSVTVS